MMTLLNAFLKADSSISHYGVNRHVDVWVVYFGDQRVLKMDHLCLGLNVCIFLLPQNRQKSLCLQTLEL